MQGHEDRIWQLEAQVRVLAERLEMVERQETSEGRELAGKMSWQSRDIGLLQSSQDGMGSFAEMTRSMLASAYLWLTVLTIVVAIEAIAIIALWVR